MADILVAMPVPVKIAQQVLEDEILQYDLSPFINSGLLGVVSDLTVDEEATYVNLAVELDDGEAVSGAIAIHRNWVIATDERRGISVLSRVAPQILQISTPDLLEHWAMTASVPKAELRTALLEVQVQARYRPHVKHALYGWWSSNTV